MKQWYAVTLLMSLLVNGALVCFFLFKYNKTDSGAGASVGTSTLLSQKTEPKPLRKIAILVPLLSPVVNQIVEGFTTTVTNESHVNAQIKIYDAKGDRTLLRSNVEAALQAKFDLIFSVGVECSKLTKELSVKRKESVPVVFGGISDPVEPGILRTKTTPENNITGVVCNHDWELQVELLCRLKKNFKRVLIVYDPTQLGGAVAHFKRATESALIARQKEVKCVEVFKVNEVVEKASSFIETSDVLLVLRDNTVMPAMEALAKLCDRHHVTLYASDLDSVKNGASMGFGITDRVIGVAAAHQAIQIVDGFKDPTELPVIDVGHQYSLVIDKNNMKKQNLVIDENLLFLINHAKLI